MDIALRTLLWLNFKAVLRRMRRQLRTVRGVIFFLIGLGMVGLWIAPQIFVNRKVPPANPAATMAIVPVVLFVLCALNLVTSTGDRAVTFTPAEIDFLFPGPFSRRSLLVYKLVKTALASIFSALIFGIFLGRFGGFYPCRVVAVWLLFQFMQLLAMILALVQSIIGERAAAAGRWWVIAGIVVVIGIAFAESSTSIHQINRHQLLAMRESHTGRIVLAPFVVFAHAMIARRVFPEFLQWATIAAVIDLAMAVVVLRLDTNYLETSAVVSARRYERLSRIRRAGLGGLAKPSSARWKIPVFPWIAGAGPLIWRQSTTALRTARNQMSFIIVFAIIAGVGISKMSNEEGALGVLVGISVYLSVILVQALKFDFRGDLDFLDLLRSLPLSSTSISLAQLVVPAAMLCIVQFCLLTSNFIAGHVPLLHLIALMTFLMPLNVLTVGIENLLFMFFPFRQTITVAGDMGFMGRQMIVFACRILLLLIAVGVSAGIGVAVWFITHHSWTLAAAAAWFPLPMMVMLIVWMIALVFRRFDPSTQTPT